ncbi:MAG TPA: apolipoprotein N-acyltransferase [Geobacteraceae bacterium]
MTAFTQPRAWSPWGCAILTGLLLALSFPQPGLSFLAWLAFVPLILACRDSNPQTAFRLGFLAGFVAYAVILYWLNIVMVTYGKLPLAVSVVLYLALCGYLALFWGGVMAANRLAELAGIPRGVTLPLLWVAGEFFRSFLLTGFPWASLGYSQFKILPLIQVADLTGVYGLSLLIMLANVVLSQLYRSLVSRQERFPGWGVLVLMALLTAVLAYGAVRLNRPEDGPLLRVALAQGNIPQDIKWNPAFQETTVATYERLSRQVGAGTSDLLVWPESALPFFYQTEQTYAARVQGLARELGSSLVVGSPAFRKDGDRVHYLNSAFLLGPTGETLGRGDKYHLVPFGEYVPLARLLPFVHKLVAGIGDFSPGEAITPLTAPFGKLGVLVCYEGIFPELSREFCRKGATLLAIVTNDAWYGRSSAPYQHFAMAVFRAVENRVPLVRAANTGISGIIDSQGHVRGMTGIFQEALLTGEIRLGTGPTIYNRWGDWFAWSCVAGSLLLMAVAYRKGVKG